MIEREREERGRERERGREGEGEQRERKRVDGEREVGREYAWTANMLRIAVQVYVTKKPGNFVQHFLEICHSNRPRSGVDLHQYPMERPPHQFFSQKMSGSRDRKFCARGDAPLKNKRRGDSRA